MRCTKYFRICGCKACLDKFKDTCKEFSKIFSTWDKEKQEAYIKSLYKEPK